MNPQSKDDRYREVSKATIDAKLYGVGFLAIHADNSFEYIDSTRIAIKGTEEAAKFEDVVKPASMAPIEHAEMRALLLQSQSLIAKAMPMMQLEMKRFQLAAATEPRAFLAEEHLKAAKDYANWLTLAEELRVVEK
jgi:hypothetical protein